MLARVCADTAVGPGMEGRPEAFRTCPSWIAFSLGPLHVKALLRRIRTDSVVLNELPQGFLTFSEEEPSGRKGNQRRKGRMCHQICLNIYILKYLWKDT